jgi:hypothetical protein
MTYLERNMTFATIGLTVLTKSKAEVLQKVVQDTLDLIATFLVLIFTPVTAKKLQDLEEIFLFMQMGKHTEKLLMKLDTEMSPRVGLRSADDETRLTSTGTNKSTQVGQTVC